MVAQTHIHNKNIVTCVDFAKELFSVSHLTTSFYNERLELSKLEVNDVEVKPFFTEGAKTQSLVSVDYRNLEAERLMSGLPQPEKKLELFVVTNINSIEYAFENWRDDFKYRMFRGKVPLTIAIDVKNNVLYLVVLHENSLELQLFNEIPNHLTEVILRDLSYDKPFKFRLKQEVLMDIISGAEGYNYAYNNLEVAFNCSTEVVITNTNIL